MLQKLFTLIICSLLVFCSKKEDKPTVKEIVKIEKQEHIAFTPIFLGLSPKMTDQEFNTSIKKLNSIGKLENNQFPLIISNEEYFFTIKKEKNTLELNFAKDTLIKHSLNPKYDYQKYLKLNLIYNFKKNKIIQLFKSKYKLDAIQLPTNIDLKRYSLPLKNYLLFKDKEKYILLGSEIISCENPLELEIKNDKARDKNGLSMPLMYDREDLFFGLNLSINYYHYQDFKELLDKMLLASENQKKNQDLLHKKEKAKLDNINQI